MTDADFIEDRPLTDAQKERLESYDLVPFKGGNLSPENLGQMVNFAQAMSRSRVALPAHFRGNVGDCLAIIEMANNLGVTPYALASGTYFVNNKLAFEGKTVLALINMHCPLEKPLSWRFEGEHGPKDKSTRKIIITGIMKGEVEPRTYESRMIRDIQPKNSPLWDADPDQQLIYLGSRRWKDRHWPQGLMGVYSKEEEEDVRPGSNATDVTPSKSAAFLENLKAGKDASNGFKEGFAEAEFVDLSEHDEPAAPPIDEPEKPKRKPRAKKEPVSAPADPEPAPLQSAEPEPAPEPLPVASEKVAAPAPKRPKPATTPEEYVDWATVWLNAAENENWPVEQIKARWSNEMSLRNKCNLTADHPLRAPLFERYMEIVHSKK